jgi:hypothetical protein
MRHAVHTLQAGYSDLSPWHVHRTVSLLVWFACPVRMQWTLLIVCEPGKADGKSGSEGYRKTVCILVSGPYANVFVSSRSHVVWRTAISPAICPQHCLRVDGCGKSITEDQQAGSWSSFCDRDRQAQAVLARYSCVKARAEKSIGRKFVGQHL